MLAAQILSLLYNIVDRIYIARIPDMGTTALGAVGLCFPIISPHKKIKDSASFDIDFIYDKLKEKYILQ